MINEIITVVELVIMLKKNASNFGKNIILITANYSLKNKRCSKNKYIFLIRM